MARCPPPALVDVTVIACRNDHVSSVRTLAAISGVGIRTLERKCAAVGISAKSLVDFARCAHAVLDHQFEWSSRGLFSDLDPRTSARLTTVGGLNRKDRPSLRDFVLGQRFISNQRFKEELLSRL